MKIYRLIFTLLALYILSSCGGTKEAIVVAPPVDYEEETLDTMVVTASPLDSSISEDEEEEAIIPNELEIYNASETRYIDILHTDLNLRFDWKNQYVLGIATLTLSPIFYPQNEVLLDAKGFDIHSVKEGMKTLDYDYDGSKLSIELSKTYNRGEKFDLIIDYTAKPNEGPIGGSAAITSDKGLFFIDPLDTDPNKPTQIWTQGETEHNSKWFPTFDKPNERMTHEIRLTVEDRYVTLSNGTLTSSMPHNNGTRTDTWVMSKPHAPYLTMLAVGEFAVVKEKWNDLELSYYVDPEYRPYAAQIFNHTPEMLTYFSSILDYEYPWDKYAQVICKDYVSGAMENTTAVIFGDFIQKTDRELIDDDNDYIVAHEMFHHWFGDLVTCESWANLTLQEGFANYSEYLWYEHKYGIDRADAHRQNELQGYLLSAQNQGMHPLIHYGYGDKEEMFDAHSYNKGGLVLHMLRDFVGDDAFFASLNKYLRDNEYTAVEVDELRIAFEDVTGMDLQWFFDQWYLSKGHPILDVNYTYDPSERTLTVDVDQIQDPVENLPIYRLEVDFAIYDQSGNRTFYPLTVNQRVQGFIIEDIDEPATMVFDGDDSQLAIINETKTNEQLVAQVKYSDNYIDRIQAALDLKSSRSFQEIIPSLLEDNYYTLRVMALDKINLRNDSAKTELVKDLLQNDPHSAVRTKALEMLIKYDYSIASPYFDRILDGQDAYSMVATTLDAMKRQNPEMAVSAAEKYKNVNQTSIVSSLADIFSNSDDPKYLNYFENKLSTVSLFAMFNFYNKYFDLLKTQDADTKVEAAKKLAAVSKTGDNMFRKFVATSTINKVKNSFTTEEIDNKTAVSKILEDIIAQETNENLLMRYNGF
jgi:aminopeptidase N